VTKPVRPNDEAVAEFRSCIRRYEEEGIGLGDRLLSEIQAAITLISAHPTIGEAVPRVRVREKVRRVPLRHFPFLLVYREYPDYLEVVALAHTSRRPKYWRSRLK
jgi:plasmid stabilization system protein ParE